MRGKFLRAIILFLINTQDLRSIQAPIKERYKRDPAAAMLTLHAEGQLGEGVTCNVRTGKALVDAGLHPATGGTGMNVNFVTIEPEVTHG